MFVWRLFNLWCKKVIWLFKGANGIDEYQVHWRCYTLEETISKIGKPLKKLTLVYKNTYSDEFIEYLKPKLQHFVRHNFVARWQDKHFKTHGKSLPTNCILFQATLEVDIKLRIYTKLALCLVWWVCQLVQVFKTLVFVSTYLNMMNGCKMMWSFFGSGHGKRPHDGHELMSTSLRIVGHK